MSCRRSSLSAPTCAWTPHRLYQWGVPFPLWGAAGERSEFNIKLSLGAPLLIFPRGYLLKYFPQVDTSTRQWGFEIRVFPLLCELLKAIEPHLPVCQLCHWQLCPNMWSSPTTKSLDPIVVTALRVDCPVECHGPATCGFACNCPESEAPGRIYIYVSNIYMYVYIYTCIYIYIYMHILSLLKHHTTTMKKKKNMYIYIHAYSIFSIIVHC